jgi:hypothetical protein
LVFKETHSFASEKSEELPPGIEPPVPPGMDAELGGSQNEKKGDDQQVDQYDHHQ